MGIATSTVATVSHPSLPSISTAAAALPRPSSIMANVARSSVLGVLENAIQIGCLKIVDKDGMYTFGQKSKSGNAVRLTIVNDSFWTRILLSCDLGFSEAYMIGDVEVNNLKAVMDLWLDNQSSMVGLSTTINRVAAFISGLSNAFTGQTRARARLNAIASYDQSNELFKAFLSNEMMYSCALWSSAEGGVRGDLTKGPRPGDLEAAQHRKIHHVLRKARVRPGHRILEFGSGWGGLAIEAARSYGCEVDTITLSVQQKALAEERIRVAGLEGRVRVHLMDYRELPPDFEKAFDAFISVEMLEHVGAKYYQTYFKLVDWALKPERATAVVTSSTFPESRYTGYQAEDFMRRYMWPNSCLPSATALVNAAQSASQGRFTLEAVENHAVHYPRTLREWGRRLEANLSQPKVVVDFPALKSPEEFAAFKRKWQYLYAYAGAGFAKGYITCHMLTFIRENDVPEIPCD
ncbi:cyclopropane fatty acid synthase [Rickenella mellea]|uniref:Cyclopropane fatty acid synthase n=1 Tax=Rickenella mellea TaxID=50990 RepID=A0A4R5XDG4_9AGAM|nr:cyclopropane fatty acid synthase [Rickenella mellea]